jgi:death on curing protein
MANIIYLVKEDILSIYNSLVNDFKSSGDPIFPSGVKSHSLLESAIGRQHVGLGNTLKYTDILSVCATLTYGICCNHAFHNGNKRTALVSMIVHLDKNDYILECNQKSLFDFMIDIADHKIAKRQNLIRGIKGLSDSDCEVAAIRQWIKYNSRTIERAEKQITYRQLRSILSRWNISLENPNKNNIDTIQYGDKFNIFKLKHQRSPIKHLTIPYPGDSKRVSVSALKRVRSFFKLQETDGIDSKVFYEDRIFIDEFINKYRKTLNRLSNR